MLKNWNNFANIKKEEGRKIIHNILTSSTPRLKQNFEIYFEIKNVDLAEFKEENQAILKYLKNVLKNDAITIEYKVKKTEKKASKLYVSEDKLEYFKKKYPYFVKLKNKFNLEIDF